MISQKHLQELLSFRAPSPVVLSVYLSAGSSTTIESLTRQVNALSRKDVSLEENEDVLRVLRFIAEEWEPGAFRGLAVFSSKRFGLWRVCALPEAVHDKLTLDVKPALAPLLAQTDQHHRFGVLLAGPERARFLEVFLGQVREYDTMTLPGEGAGHDYIKSITDSLEALSRNQSFQRIVVGVAPELALPLVNHLHSHLQQNLILDADLDPQASAPQVLARISACEDEARKVRESVLVHRLMDAVNGGKLGITGLERVLWAQQQGRLRLLLVRDGFEKMGRRCPGCGRLSFCDPKCVDCRRPTEAVFNMVSAIVDRALEQGVEVFRLSHDTPLDNLGRIGAELCDDKGITPAPVRRYEEPARTADHAADPSSR